MFNFDKLTSIVKIYLKMVNKSKTNQKNKQIWSKKTFYKCGDDLRR
jgi:hypothetical protein